METIVLDRDIWMRGEGSGQLFSSRRKHNKETCRCVMGMIAHKFGVPDSVLDGRGYLGVSDDVRSKVLNAKNIDKFIWVLNDSLNGDSEDANELTSLNDYHETTDTDKVKGFNEITNKHGINFVLKK
jgi:hypothetical protein